MLLGILALSPVCTCAYNHTSCFYTLWGEPVWLEVYQLVTSRRFKAATKTILAHDCVKTKLDINIRPWIPFCSRVAINTFAKASRRPATSELSLLVPAPLLLLPEEASAAGKASGLALASWAPWSSFKLLRKSCTQAHQSQIYAIAQPIQASYRAMTHLLPFLLAWIGRLRFDLAAINESMSKAFDNCGSFAVMRCSDTKFMSISQIGRSKSGNLTCESPSTVFWILSFNLIFHIRSSQKVLKIQSTIL